MRTKVWIAMLLIVPMSVGCASGSGDSSPVAAETVYVAEAPTKKAKPKKEEPPPPPPPFTFTNAETWSVLAPLYRDELGSSLSNREAREWTAWINDLVVDLQENRGFSPERAESVGAARLTQGFYNSDAMKYERQLRREARAQKAISDSMKDVAEVFDNISGGGEEEEEDACPYVAC